uniref:Uncharacterized protein n=1 Tax=Helianthus annuus TaxID=4232 RepID=A0A251V5C0_HELAN
MISYRMLCESGPVSWRGNTGCDAAMPERLRREGRKVSKGWLPPLLPLHHPLSDLVEPMTSFPIQSTTL